MGQCCIGCCKESDWCVEGIVVSARDEQLMAAIIDGKANAAEERRRLVEQFKKQNAVRSV